MIKTNYPGNFYADLVKDLKEKLNRDLTEKLNRDLTDEELAFLKWLVKESVK